MVKVPDLYDRCRRRRRWTLDRRVHPEPQKSPHIDILCIKMIPMSSRTLWGRSRTYTTDDADAGGENVPIGHIPSPRNHSDSI